ncbi:MAG: OmpA family protein [Pyrinomonadaceae bacterium]
MSPTDIGVTGLFTVVDAYTIGKGEFRFSASASRFHRDPGYLRITQFPMSFTVGLRNNIELFFSTNVNQRTKVNAPFELSAPLLNSALASTGVNGSSLTGSGNVIGGFFLLPGLPVSGALVGGTLPGLPIGQGKQVFDPILNRNKNAFSTPGYFNDLPFVAPGGSAYGDTTIGIKYRFKDFTPKGFINQTGVLGYVKFPSQSASSLFGNPQNRLFAGATSGTTDFAIFFLNSLYAYNRQQNGKAKEIINLHTNIGYVRNGDPKINGIKLLDRKDAFISSIGTDSLISRYFQLLGEAKYTRYIGGGTPNSRNPSPVDLTIGTRIFPLGMPKDVLECGNTKPPKDKLFLSFTAGYRYSLNLSNLSGLARNNSGFIFQLALGRSNNRSKFSKCPGPSEGACNVGSPLSIKKASVDRERIIRGQDAFFDLQVENGEKPNILYTLILPNNKELRVKQQGEEPEDYVVEFDGRSLPIKATFPEDTSLINLKIPFSADFQAGRGKIKVRASFTAKGETCPPIEMESEAFDVIENPPVTRPVLTLTPDRMRISANSPRDYSLNATVGGVADNLAALTWNPPSEIVLTGSNADRVRSFNSANLRPGQTYTIGVTASVGQESDTKYSEFKVNNPPTVNLEVNPNGTLSQPILKSDPVSFVAKGEDADGDALEYTWELFNASDNKRTPLRVSSPTNVLPINNLELNPGRYEVSVTASDGLDAATVESSDFYVEEVLSRSQSVFFGFDCYNLRKSEVKKLSEEARWLTQDPNGLLLIRAEGNADAYGSNKYNLCLGCRRACEVKQFLMRNGVSSERIRIVISHGKSKVDPNAPYSSKNRRVDLVYIRGEQNYVATGGQPCECPAANTKQPRCGKRCSVVTKGKKAMIKRIKRKQARIMGSE